jgi:hypothetical protein
MNWKRIALGGLLGGIAMNALDFAVGMLVLGERYMKFQEAGVFLKEPRLPFVPIWIAGIFVLAFLASWFYAAVRPRLGPGPKTALLVGLALGLVGHVMYNVSAAAWGLQGRFMPLVWMVSGIVELVVGTLVAGWVYKEE